MSELISVSTIVIKDCSCLMISNPNTAYSLCRIVYVYSTVIFISEYDCFPYNLHEDLLNLNQEVTKLRQNIQPKQ